MKSPLPTDADLAAASARVKAMELVKAKVSVGKLVVDLARKQEPEGRRHFRQ
jgi:hypothetical protein